MNKTSKKNYSQAEISLNRLLVPFDRHINGFRLIKFDNPDFFGPEDREKFNETLRRLNNRLQYTFNEIKSSEISNNFNRLTFGVKVVLFLFQLFCLFFYFAVESKYLKLQEFGERYTWIIVTSFSVTCVFLMVASGWVLSRKSNYVDYQSAKNSAILSCIEKEKNEFENIGYVWSFSASEQILDIKKQKQFHKNY